MTDTEPSEPEPEHADVLTQEDFDRILSIINEAFEDDD